MVGPHELRRHFYISPGTRSSAAQPVSSRRYSRSSSLPPPTFVAPGTLPLRCQDLRRRPVTRFGPRVPTRAHARHLPYQPAPHARIRTKASIAFVWPHSVHVRMPGGGCGSGGREGPLDVIFDFGLGRVGLAAAGASTLIGGVLTNAFAALALAARHGLQRVCVYGVPLITVMRNTPTEDHPLQARLGRLPSASLERCIPHNRRELGQWLRHVAVGTGAHSPDPRSGYRLQILLDLCPQPGSGDWNRSINRRPSGAVYHTTRCVSSRNAALGSNGEAGFHPFDDLAGSVEGMWRAARMGRKWTIRSCSG